jgi:hypothetical protein
MTAQEMQYNILLQIDSLFENAAPGYNPTQIQSFMNRAQRRVFNEKKLLYDTDESVKRMLSPLNKRASTTDNTIKTVTVALDLYKHTNGRYYTLPSNVGFITEEYVKITPVGGATITKPVLVKPITYDYYVKNYENRYKKPSVELIWRLDYNYDSAQTGYIVELITDGSTIDSYHISYLKYPQNMVIGTTNCEIIDETFHDEIVSETVKMITAALNDEGYSVAVNEANSDK